VEAAVEAAVEEAAVVEAAVVAAAAFLLSAFWSACPLIAEPGPAAACDSCAEPGKGETVGISVALAIVDAHMEKPMIRLINLQVFFVISNYLLYFSTSYFFHQYNIKFSNCRLKFSYNQKCTTHKSDA
jgi:hypothetical protein